MTWCECGGPRTGRGNCRACALDRLRLCNVGVGLALVGTHAYLAFLRDGLRNGGGCLPRVDERAEVYGIAADVLRETFAGDE